MSQKNKNKKINNKWKLIFIGISILTIILLFINNDKKINGYNYKFAYSKGNSLYVLDLSSDTNQKADSLQEKIRYISWNKDGSFAFSNEKGALYISKSNENPRKVLSGNIKENFFWDNDMLYVNESPIQRAFEVSIEGKAAQISSSNYDQKLNGMAEKSIFPASVDGNYFTKTNYTKEKIQTDLISKLNNRNYKMPDGAYRPQISPNNRYIAFQNNALNGKVYIFSFNDAKLNKFDKPIYMKDYSAFSWIDDSQILFIKRTQDPSDTPYGIFNLVSGKEKIIYNIYDSPVYAYDLYLTPDSKYLVFRTFKKDYFSEGELNFLNLKSHKIDKKIQFDYGEWSEPL